MKPLVIVFVVAAIAIGVGTYAMPWYAVNQGATSFELAPGRGEVCANGRCKDVDPDDSGYDSTWLGLVSACRIAGGLGLFAAGIAALLAAGKQLGGGIKKGHLIVGAVIPLLLAIGTVATKPGEASFRIGVWLTLAGLVVTAAGATRVSNPDDD